MIRYFAGHPTAANLLMLAILALGVLAIPQLQRDTFPRIAPTEIQVAVKYTGATPSDVELRVCRPIEDAVSSVAELVEVRCDSRENRALATVQMREGADIDQVFTDVKSAVEAITTFPERAERPIVEKVERVEVIAELAITGDMSVSDLRDYVERLRTRLRRHPQIAQVTVGGFSDREILIEIPRETARRYRLSMSAIAEAVKRQSVDLPAGVTQSPQGDWVVRFADERRAPAAFKSLIIRTDGLGGQVRLGDVAKITTAFASPEDRVLVNGKRAALLQIAKTSTQDTLKVKAAIDAVLKSERARVPSSIEYTFIRDVSSNIKERLRLLGVNGLQGLALVFLTMWLFFSFRFSFWVAMGLPVSFLGAVFFMWSAGLTINMMTMVALIVAIGLLMDDAIVIAENVAAHHRKGRSALDAAVMGTQEVLPGVISSFLTTAIVLGPIALLAGKIGAVLKLIPVILLVTLLISLVEAFLILPAHLKHALPPTAQRRRGLQAFFDGAFDFIRLRIFGPLADWAIRWRYFTIGLALMAMMGAFATIPAGILKFRAFPQLESDVIQARILLPQGTPLARTQEVVKKLTAALHKVDQEFSARQRGGQRLVRSISQIYSVNIDAYETGPHVATISANLLPAQSRVGTIDDMLNRWRELTGEVPDVLALKFTDRERGVAGKAINIRLSGPNLEKLKQASHELQVWLAGFRGVKDLSDDLRPGKKELRLHLAESASLSGLQARQIAEEVRASLLGKTGLTVQAGYEIRDVTVRLAAGDRQTRRDVEDIAVTGPNGKIVPVSALVRIEETRGYARIHRVNGQRTVAVEGTVDTEIGNAREIMAATKERFLPKFKKKYPGVRVSFAGQGAEAATTGASLGRNIIIGLLGVFILLAFQFRSYVEPLAVFFAVPMGMVGAIAGHLLLGYQLSMPSLLGMATLAGVVVNDSILLVTFMKRRIAEGDELEVAAGQAARDRFRAVMLTSLTTIAGLLPLLLETSTQAQFLIPLIVSLAFGLLVATVFALIIVPAFYCVIGDITRLGRPAPEAAAA